MQVREATLQDKASWDRFVENEGGSFFHYFDWKTIYEVNNWRYIPLLVENETQDITGILPLVKIRFRLYSKLVSLPDGASGGVVFKKTLTETDKQQVFETVLHYIDKHHSHRCSAFYLKENLTLDDASRRQPTGILVKNGFIFRADTELQFPCTYYLPLSTLFDKDIWEGLWEKDLRSHIRRAQKKGVIVKQDTNGKYQDDVINMLLSIYKKFDETPPSKEAMRRRLTTFEGKTKVWVALHQNTPIAALVCYYHKSLLCYASKLGYRTPARDLHTNVFLVSEAIRDACENGYRFFEFGVTETPTLAQWKEQFKPIKIPLRMYQRKYSSVRSFFENTPTIMRWSLNHIDYIWMHRKRLVRKMMKSNASCK